MSDLETLAARFAVPPPEALIFTAPEKVKLPHDEDDRANVFLAGSIEQGKAKPWQTLVVEKLKDTFVTLFNPRREAWDATWVQDITNPDFAEQVTWELEMIDRSNIVFFYIQGDTLSPITLMELGIVLTERAHRHEHGKYLGVVVVCEPEFWRLGNVQVLCKQHKITVLPTLERGIDHLFEMCARFTCGH